MTRDVSHYLSITAAFILAPYALIMGIGRGDLFDSKVGEFLFGLLFVISSIALYFASRERVTKVVCVVSLLVFSVMIALGLFLHLELMAGFSIVWMVIFAAVALGQRLRRGGRQILDGKS